MSDISTPDRRIIKTTFFAIGIGLIAVSLAIAAIIFAVRDNSDRITDQEGDDDKARAQIEELRRLNERLQQQVRDLGGTPVAQPPSASPQAPGGATGAGTARTPGPRATAGPSPRPAPSRTPGASPSQTPRPSTSPSASPDPSASCIKIMQLPSVCLGETRRVS